jgi:hypothetical protein
MLRGMAEQHHNRTDAPAAVGPAPIPALQLADRQQLHASLRPNLSAASFSNWLNRAMKDGFPAPLRTGRRACAWYVVEIQQWLASRPRKGVFTGRRRGEAA